MKINKSEKGKIKVEKFSFLPLSPFLIFLLYMLGSIVIKVISFLSQFVFFLSKENERQKHKA